MTSPSVLQQVSLFHVLKKGQRYIEYADSFVDYISVDEYYTSEMQAQFRVFGLNSNQKTGDKAHAWIEIEPFGYDDESKQYFKMQAKAINISRVDHLAAFAEFEKSHREHELKLACENEKLRIMASKTAALRQSALEKLTHEERLLFDV